MPAMARQSSQNSPSGQDVPPVRLPKILGVRPGVYLVGLYAVVIVALLFALLMLPGLRRPGSLVVFDSSPRTAAVLVDGAYVGMTPCKVFIDAGSRSVLFRAPGFSGKTLDLEVGSRAFASLFAPKRQDVTATLAIDDATGPLELALPRYVGWSLTGKPGSIYQFPMELSEAAYRTSSSVGASELGARLDVLGEAPRWTTEAALLRDLLRALALTEAAGSPPSPLSFLAGAREALAFLSTNQGASEWLASIDDWDGASLVAGSPWRRHRSESAAAEAAGIGAAAALRSAPERMKVGGIVFVRVPAGSVVLDASQPSVRKTAEFWIAESQIEPSRWAAFTAAESRWAAANAVALREQGLVDGAYLAAAPEGSPATSSRANVSWNAAEAFCAWLEADSAPAGSKVRLPTEAEWQRAAELGVIEKGALWDWCDDPWTPFPFLGAADGSYGTNIPERSVRGGSWANPAGSVAVDARGGLDASICSPFVGFRPVLVFSGPGAP